jgi:hypothetical protein
MYRESFYDRTSYIAFPRKIVIGDYCLKCGEKRGSPYPFQFYEDGATFTVDKWDNPCGHFDSYRSAWEEHVRLQKKRRYTFEQLNYFLYAWKRTRESEVAISDCSK